MNKKLLAILLILPVGFFAADKVLGLNGPGGGDQKKQSTATSAQAGEDAQPLPGVVSLQDLDDAARATAKTFAREMKEALEEEDGLNAFRNSNRVNVNDGRFKDDQRKFLEKEVGQVLQDSDVFGLVLEDQFSRCGSGYHFQILAEGELLTNKGYLVRDQGCRDRPFAIFTVDFAAGKVGVELPGDAGLLSIRDYLSLLKES